MENVDDFARNTKARHKDSRATFDNALDVFFKLTRNCCQQVNAERLVGEFVHRSDFFVELAWPHGGCAKCSDTTGFAYCSDEFVVRNATHSGEHDGVFDIE